MKSSRFSELLSKFVHLSKLIEFTRFVCVSHFHYYYCHRKAVIVTWLILKFSWVWWATLTIVKEKIYFIVNLSSVKILISDSNLVSGLPAISPKKCVLH